MSLNGVRQHLTYANVMATIAVFAVLGGGAYAATKIPKNSVGAKQIKKNAVTTAKIKNGAVTSAKVKKGTLLASNFKSGQLPAGATGPRGEVGPAGLNGATGPAGANGAIGPVGAVGATGPAGAVGATGPKGATGEKGATGAAGVTDAIVVAGGGEDAPALTGATHTQVLSTTYITLPVVSDILVLGSMGSKQIQCDANSCEGTAPADGTFVGLYLDTDPDGPTPTPIPEGGVVVTGGSLNTVSVPPTSGVIKNVAPGNYKIQLIASSFNLGLNFVEGLGGGTPRVAAVATGSS